MGYRNRATLVVCDCRPDEPLATVTKPIGTPLSHALPQRTHYIQTDLIKVANRLPISWEHAASRKTSKA
jgi:hypothetical protein